MTEDDLIRDIQLKQQLSELDGSQVSEYDPSDGMETVEELKKYVRFLYELNQEKDKRILQMESDMSDIKAELKEETVVLMKSRPSARIFSRGWRRLWMTRNQTATS